MSRATDRTETYRQYERLADQLALMPQVIARLLVEHADDGTGYCAECRQGGTGTAAVEHPCSLHQLALMALTVRKRRKQAITPERPPHGSLRQPL